MYEPETASICYCGHIIVSTGLPLKELVPDMNRRAKWNLSNEQLDDAQRNILMWEDKSLGDCRHLDDLDKPLDQALAELADGVVIIFQKHCNLYTEPKPNLKTVVEYFRDKENRQDVQFVNRSEPEHPGFVIRLNQRQHYKELAEEAGRVLNRDPRLIQFFKSTQFTRDQAGAPIRSTETKNIEEMIFIPQNSRDTRRIRKKIFYQNIDIPIEDFETKRSILVKFVHPDLTDDDIVVHVNKNSVVSDLLFEVKNKITGIDNKKLRLIEYVNSRIVTIHPENENLSDQTNLGATNKQFRVEAVPDDQLKFSPGEVLIQVCHFNNAIQSNFGIPILVKIKNSEKIIDVRQRIQKTLDVPDKDFVKWKMALITNSSPKYYSELNDNELVQTSQFHIQTRDGVPLVYNRIWIGLDHPNRQRKDRPNHRGPTIEKALKIHN